MLKSQFPEKQYLESKITFFTFNVKNSSKVNFHFSALPTSKSSNDKKLLNVIQSFIWYSVEFWWMLWHNVHGRWYSSKHLTWHKCCYQAQPAAWCLYGAWPLSSWSSAGLETTTSCLKVFLRILLILLIAIGIRVFSCLCCCLCGSGSTLGANIMSLARLLVATASTNTRNTALTIVHMDLLYIFIKVHQQVKQCQ